MCIWSCLLHSSFLILNTMKFLQLNRPKIPHRKWNTPSLQVLSCPSLSLQPHFFKELLMTPAVYNSSPPTHCSTYSSLASSLITPWKQALRKVTNVLHIIIPEIILNFHLTSPLSSIHQYLSFPAFKTFFPWFLWCNNLLVFHISDQFFCFLLIHLLLDLYR